MTRKHEYIYMNLSKAEMRRLLKGVSVYKVVRGKGKFMNPHARICLRPVFTKQRRLRLKIRKKYAEIRELRAQMK